MSATGPTGSDDEREVLSSLPRSRRQRPSAAREAARAKRTTAAGSKAAPAKKKPAAKAAAKPKPKPAAKPSAVAAAGAGGTKAKVRGPKRSVPPAGYATPRAKGEHGSADPGAAIAGVVRSVLKLIPRP